MNPIKSNTRGVFTEAVVQRCSIKKAFLENSQNSQENTCARVYSFTKKETLAQVFSCEFCKISKNTSGGYFFNQNPTVKHLRWTVLRTCSLFSQNVPSYMFGRGSEYTCVFIYLIKHLLYPIRIAIKFSTKNTFEMSLGRQKFRKIQRKTLVSEFLF